MKIGILGGAGKEGRGLAARWRAAGHTVMLGSRDPAGAAVPAVSNREAAGCEVVVVSVPYPAHAPLLTELRGQLAGRIVIDLVVPLVPPVDRVTLPRDGAAALEARRILGDGSRIVAALHHVSSVHLGDPAAAIDCDVLLCGDDADLVAVVAGLIEDLGLRALDAGPLANAVALEAMTPVLLHLNKRYGKRGLGLRITGL
ncbi:MAG TPA: NAD(P)-binding domain-containing protein [Kofleriaceae bacterium]|nr:NAD(P)-binding domain-containing protein [Kofleriaceae bacterium]